jgi:hypothetical protein
VSSLVPSSSHDLTFRQGSRFSPKQSAQPLFTVFYNILLKCRSTSSPPSGSKWPGSSHDCSFEPGWRGFHSGLDGSQTCQYESQISRTQVQHTRTFNTSSTNRQSLAFNSSSSFLSPDSANSVGNPSDAAATLVQQRAELKAANNAAHRICTSLATSSGDRGTWAGVLGQVVERDNSSTRYIRRT